MNSTEPNPLTPTKLGVEPRQVEGRLSAKRLSLSAAARLLGVNISTIWRWRLKGVRGVMLQTFCIGGKRFTTEESLTLFIDATTAAATGDDSLPTPRTSTQRERDIDQAERELDHEGI